MKLRALLLAGLCVVGGQASAGLFNDDEAREQVRQVDARVLKLEDANKQQADINRQQADINKQQADSNRQQADVNRQQADTSRQQADSNKQQADASRQQTRSMLDLQTQIETQNAELRRMQGQSEELLHSLQDAEKRQKDFYIDLDTRVRHFETVEAAALAAPPPPPPPPDKAADIPADDGPAVENRAYEAAYKLYKADKHQDAINAFQEFLRKFPGSVHIPNVYYEAGSAYFALKNYKSALANYQLLASKYSFSPKAPDAMLSVADCQEALRDKAAARKTLQQIIAKYPGSETADEARKRLTNLK